MKAHEFMSFSVLSGLLAVVLSGCSQEAVVENASLSKGAEQWQTAFNEGNQELGGSLYSEDAILMPPNEPIVKGRAAIAETFVGTDVAGVSLTLTPAESVSSGGLGFVRGAYRMFTVSGAPVDTGKYIELYKKEGGQWLIYRDIYNSDMPLAADPVALYKPSVDAYVNVWNTGDMGKMSEIFAQDAVRKTPSKESDANNLEGIKAEITRFRTSFPDVKIQIEQDVYMPNMAVVHWRFTGTNTGPGQWPATGKKVSVPGISTQKFKNGKIVSEVVRFDRLDMMQQLGFTLMPPGK